MARQSAPWPSIVDFGGATPINRDKWLSLDDYPTSVLQRGGQGDVVVRFIIGVDGRVSDCALDTSSGIREQDVIPCKVLAKRARFRPAVSEDGTPRIANGRYSIAFWLPD